MVLPSAALLAAGCALAAGGGSHQAAGGARAGCSWPAGLRGNPSPAALRRAGMTVWYDGRWHIGARGGSAAHSFTGTIRTARPVGHPRLVGGEGRDRATANGSRLQFRLRATRGDTDRLDFAVPCGNVSLALRRDGATMPATAIHLGAAGAPAPSATFTAAAPARTGVAGQVTVGPSCPVEGTPDCTGGPKPIKATVDVDAVSGARNQPEVLQRVTSVTTDDAGRFDVALAPGRYRLTAHTADGQGVGVGGQTPTYVTVVSGIVTDADVRIDTGIR
jgi:hypothetical protein